MGLGSFGKSRLGESERRSLRVEADESVRGRSRLKAGCSQDWLPHKNREICTDTKLLRRERRVSLS